MDFLDLIKPIFPEKVWQEKLMEDLQMSSITLSYPATESCIYCLYRSGVCLIPDEISYNERVWCPMFGTKDQGVYTLFCCWPIQQIPRPKEIQKKATEFLNNELPTLAQQVASSLESLSFQASTWPFFFESWGPHQFMLILYATWWYIFVIKWTKCAIQIIQELN